MSNTTQDCTLPRNTTVMHVQHDSGLHTTTRNTTCCVGCKHLYYVMHDSHDCTRLSTAHNSHCKLARLHTSDSTATARLIHAYDAHAPNRTRHTQTTAHNCTRVHDCTRLHTHTHTHAHTTRTTYDCIQLYDCTLTAHELHTDCTRIHRSRLRQAILKSEP
jgi:hypothetical protein